MSMERTSAFNIWFLTFITDEDKAWIDGQNCIRRIEKGVRYMGEECWVLHPYEQYLDFLFLKFGDRLKSLPLEQYMMQAVKPLYKP